MTNQKENLGLGGAMFLIIVAMVLALVTMTHGQSPQPVLLCFSASWCEECQRMAPVWKSLERRGVKIVKVDASEGSTMADVWRVQRIPTTIAVGRHSSGAPEELARITGYAGEERVLNLLRGN
jgi:thiol-disulfide isomerase/thioredoxin